MTIDQKLGIRLNETSTVNNPRFLHCKSNHFPVHSNKKGTFSGQNHLSRVTEHGFVNRLLLLLYSVHVKNDGKRKGNPEKFIERK